MLTTLSETWIWKHCTFFQLYFGSIECAQWNSRINPLWFCNRHWLIQTPPLFPFGKVSLLLPTLTHTHTHTQLKLEPMTMKHQNIQLTQRLSFLFPAIVFIPKIKGKHLIYHLQHLPDELRCKVPSPLRA